MPEPENQQDPQGQSATPTQGDPAGQPAGQSQQQPLEAAQDDLPEKFRGKSAKEIATSYLELEKHTGKTSQEVKEARENLAQWETLGKVIQGNPALEKLIAEEIEKIGGKRSDGNDSPKDTNQDVRIATTDSIFKEFEREHGIDRLPGESQNVLQGKIGKELAEILDPTGSKDLKQLLGEVPLNRLGGFLKKAYKLATADDDKERARVQGLMQARQNREAEFGSIPFSSGSSANQSQLTEDELKVSKKLGISPEKYLKQKQAMNK